ncbi:MAG: hypothetical protein IBJ04_09130 [Hydrogenophaga sp.]|uniref:uridine kinase family protein n=1 Tax=Hydrogenophaga sp. TaxID=1904254 RepID=UPI00257F0769|nr:hypothetical protein [Hydrogenophaga sp.]MBL0944472.1 hypothetical protein [Hydrogenophaga sp.]
MTGRPVPVRLLGAHPLDELVAHIRALPRTGRAVCVVAIDGRSGSGKSTLAQALAEALPPARVIDGDDFYSGGVDLRHDTPAERAAACIDWRRQREVLTALRAGRPATYRAFDWDAFDGSLCATETRVAPAPLVVLEGVYSARAELADLLDLRAVLGVDDALREQRLRAREGGIGPWERQWIEAEVPYFERLLAGVER